MENMEKSKQQKNQNENKKNKNTPDMKNDHQGNIGSQKRIQL